jgi:hypothetical protein
VEVLLDHGLETLGMVRVLFDEEGTLLRQLLSEGVRPRSGNSD